jgi:hypothetical protein
VKKYFCLRGLETQADKIKIKVDGQSSAGFPAPSGHRLSNIAPMPTNLDMGVFLGSSSSRYRTQECDFQVSNNLARHFPLNDPAMTVLPSRIITLLWARTNQAD